MQSIRYFSQIVEKGIGNIQFPISPSNLYDPLRYFLVLGGKRMRPVLTLMATDAFDVDCNKSLPAALSVELFHNFSLIHDDIMDEAPIRRGQATVHTKWNQNIAILSGDVLLVKAYQLLAKQNNEHLPALLHLFNQTAIEVCEGQQMDMDFETRSDVSIDDYVEMIRLKTSVLLGCALEMGAIIANASESDRKLIYDFGQHIGIAFQIQDDYLDAFGYAAIFGKEAGGDIKQNKKTFLLLHALEVANAEQKAALEVLLKTNSEDKVEKVLAIFKACGVDAWAEDLKAKYLKEAFEHLEAIAVVSNRKQPLIELANYLMNRNQ
jgi:geranylgeranyl diphosphate synthase type II